MRTNHRRRVVGLILAVLTPFVAAAFVAPADAVVLTDPGLDNCAIVTGNLVVNCGFEATVTGGVVPGWNHLVSRASVVYAPGAGLAYSGSHVLDFYSTGTDDVWTQTVPVKPHTQYLVGAQFNASQADGPSPQEDITFTATNVAGFDSHGYPIYSSGNENTVWVRGAQIVTTGSGHSMTLTFAGANKPGATYVDNVFVVQQHTGCNAVANNLVKNCGFETAGPASWTRVGTNHDTFLSSTSNSGDEALVLAATLPNTDTWTQSIAVHPHTAYRLSYWVSYDSDASAPDNTLSVSVSNVPAGPGGKKTITTKNVANKFWSLVTTTFVTGSSSTSVLTLTGANSPAHTYLDDFSVTAVPKVTLKAKGHKVTTTLAGLGGQKVLLELLAHHHWVVAKSFTAPKTGSSTSWTANVGSGKYRAVAQPAPGYGSATSNTVKVH